MNNILLSFERLLVFGKSYIKVILIFITFFLLVFLSCFIMDRTLTKKLLGQTEESMNDVQAFITSLLSEPKVALSFIADDIQRMIQDGESFESIKAYMDQCSTDEFKEKIHSYTYYRIYGYFDIFDSFYDGGGFVPAPDFSARERPWYTAAVESGNEPVISPVYIDSDTRTPVVGYARRINDKDGNLVGVVSMDVPVGFIHNIVAYKQVTKNSYVFMLDEEMIVIIHPAKELVGNILGSTYKNMEPYTEYFEQGVDLLLHNYKSYLGPKSLLFGRRIDNGWYVCFVVPESEYYKELYNMIAIISVLGFVMASLLSLILVRIDHAKRKADTENKQKSDFLAVMSHEIRTPMNAIMGITEVQLHEDDSDLPENIKEAFERIYYSGSLLLQIINDLLDLSKIESGKLELIPDRYEVASLINEVVQINKIRFDSKPIEFKLDIDENIPKSLIGDEIRIKQILNNLLSNAFKYTWKGEVKLSIKAMDYGKKPDIVLVFSISDTGQGISAHDLKNLYTEYARFNTKANRSTVGTGLGLNITQKLVEMMQGEIAVESELEKGSTFTVRIPQKINGSSTVLGKEVTENLKNIKFSRATKIKKHSILREKMPYGSILIVDDVEMNLFVAKLLMRPYGLKIDTASSGFEAIDIIKNERVYDIVFMDHMMPKMDGIEATKIIRDFGYKNPIIALTANAVYGQSEMFLANGFNDFISKPIDIRRLNSILNKYIRDKNREDGSMDIDIRNMPGLDFQKGLAVFEGEIEDYAAALLSFIKNAPDTISKLRGVSEDSLSDYAITVHGLKSISAWICAEKIHHEALELETFAKAGAFSAVSERNEEFLNSADVFIKNLEIALKKEPRS